MNCPNCGTHGKDSAAFCTSCGKPLPQPELREEAQASSGLLRRIFGWTNKNEVQSNNRPTYSPPMLEVSTRDFVVKAVGESNYQKEIQEARDERGSDFLYVYLKRESENPHDPNAVAVRSVLGGTLGYLPRELAREYASVLDEVEATGLVARCQARVDGVGGNRPKGIRLDAGTVAGVRQRLEKKQGTHLGDSRA